MSEVAATGPERLTEADIRQLIQDIVGGESNVPDYGSTELSLEDMRAQVQREQRLVDSELRSKDPAFVMTDGGVRRAHKPSCFHVRHVMDREEAWRYVLTGPIRVWDLGLVQKMPKILSRFEVEALNSYVTCQACSPTLDHTRKVWRLNAGKPMRSISFGVHHVGREIFTPDGDSLGVLISHQRTITGTGVRSVTVTSKTTIESDGSESYVVAPKN